MLFKNNFKNQLILRNLLLARPHCHSRVSLSALLNVQKSPPSPLSLPPTLVMGHALPFYFLFFDFFSGSGNWIYFRLKKLISFSFSYTSFLDPSSLFLACFFAGFPILDFFCNIALHALIYLFFLFVMSDDYGKISAQEVQFLAYFSSSYPWS